MTGPGDAVEPRVLARRSFDLDRQRAFARLSGDFNPLHLDPIRSRRLLFGEPVVHGVHTALWALDRWAAEHHPGPFRLRRVRLEFPAPLPVGRPAEAVLRTGGDTDTLQLSVRSETDEVTRITAAWEHASGTAAVAPAEPWPDRPRDRTIDELADERGTLELRLDAGRFDDLLPALARSGDPHQIAFLLATTRLVGMVAPGLRSLYTGLAASFEVDGPDADALAYEVVTAHPGTGLVRLKLGGAAAGEIRALVRPGPVDQLSAGDAAERVEPGEFSGVTALVVGGSRGLGEVSSKLLGAGGADVTCTYARGRDDAERVVAEIRGAGGEARAALLDVLDPAADPPAASHLLYFASPRIRKADPPGFDIGDFDRYCAFYLEGFLRVVDRVGPDHVLYPSTVFIDDPPAGFESYAAAKRVGELACDALRQTRPTLRVRAPRLPRLRTDQTAGVVRVASEDPADRLLTELRALHGAAGPA